MDEELKDVTSLELTSVEISAIVIEQDDAERRRGPFDIALTSAIHKLKASQMKAEFLLEHAYCDFDAEIDEEYLAMVPSDMPLMTQLEVCSDPNKHTWTPEQWLKEASIEITKSDGIDRGEV